MTFKQAERLKTDGAVSVSRDDKDHFRISVGEGDGLVSIRVSAFNAARIFGMLALFLGIQLPSKLGKAIKF